MLDKKIAKSKRSQVGDTMTWVVATIVIIIILGVFLFASNILAEAKNISQRVKGVFSSGQGDYGEINWIKSKTSLAFEVNSQNKGKIEAWINEIPQ